MKKRFLRQISLILILFIIFVWIKRDDIFIYMGIRPAAESLEFNQSSELSNARPIIYSKDEEINVNVFEQSQPSVVNIATVTLSRNWFRRIIPRQGQGSGFIIDSRGYILTNNHVVANAQEITVTLSGGEKIEATLVGRDAYSDLAVIKVPSESVDVAALLGNSDQIRVGQKAIAIGNPFGLSHTLTTGIVSALDRSIETSEGVEIDGLIQTDAAINPGNSGGPLLNSSGEVIGINTAIFSVSGGYQGIGFAIPINKAKEVASHIITSGQVPRPWLGITSINVKYLSNALDLPVDFGALVQEIVPGSPAARAGLQGGNRLAVLGNVQFYIGGDIIVSIDDEKITDDGKLASILLKKKVGQNIKIGLYREDRYMELSTVLTERDDSLF